MNTNRYRWYRFSAILATFAILMDEVQETTDGDVWSFMQGVPWALGLVYLLILAVLDSVESDAAKKGQP